MVDHIADENGAGVQITYGADNEEHTIFVGVLIHSTSATAISSGQNFSTLFNNGTVSSATNRGVSFGGDDAYIFNAAGAWIIGNQEGVYSNGDRNIVENEGFIRSIEDVGVYFAAGSQDHSLTNSGTIMGHTHGVLDFSTNSGGNFRNGGLIYGDDFGIRIFTNDGLTTTVLNKAGATIKGLDAAIATATSGGLLLTNRGLVDGIIDLNVDEAAPDIIRNFQNIRGQVFLGLGNDKYNAPTGTAGKIFGEEGVDQLIGGNFTDRLNGGLENDILNGRANRDFFFFDTAIIGGLNVDTVNGFVHGQDEFMLDDDIFLGLTPGALAFNRFVTGPFTNGVQRIALLANGTLIHDANGNLAGGNPSPFAKVAPGTPLTHIDFTIIA